ncbi:hypothetical secreted protein [Pseudomonas knackmussii B13]|uniref:Hypothetical secreted protein n=1 Tax=Pseudomonas knackmussii (strain DSM 6978 / CCUG 54928 / LMG 23759 / B13) TaxID=1301098 RepID=A0A024HI97_PSEKB|nr:hypothetical protein [Pseudomonas knackmussii]CDF84374.1 hypothetical secreted protein [Pseudomonas knackmussii B13]
MSRKLLPSLALLSLLGSLGACAGREPAPRPDLARVDLGQEAPNQLYAVALDGRPVKDLRYFDVGPGSHRLAVELDKSGDDSPDQGLCKASLDYPGFVAGQHYRLRESTLGSRLVVRLYGADGQPLDDPQPLSCFPG